MLDIWLFNLHQRI